MTTTNTTDQVLTCINSTATRLLQSNNAPQVTIPSGMSLSQTNVRVDMKIFAFNPYSKVSQDSLNSNLISLSIRPSNDTNNLIV
jgi:hypothetical protein